VARNLETVKGIHDVLLGEAGLIGGEDDAAERIVDHFREVAEPDFECVMVAPDQAFRTTMQGAEGFLSSWADWLSPFHDFKIVVEGLQEVDPDTVMDFVRLTARTDRGGVPVETKGAGVWRFRHGRLHRVEFHLDREVARRSAGLA
jgi:ketosteroid isomerase-like protein